MIHRDLAMFAVACACVLGSATSQPVLSCCAVGPSGKPIVNADQTVIILWDAATKTQHFIRKASFASATDNFGFIIPSPTQPELDESSNDAFSALQALTEPERLTRKRPRSSGCGCEESKSTPPKAASEAVRVLDERLVAGFKASVLESRSADALVNWLRDNGYAYSPAVAAWAKPYVDGGWKFTALKLAAHPESAESKIKKAAALRLSFQTDRPVFPYREPDSAQSAEQLGAKDRMLRIYFIGEARYQGAFSPKENWSGQVAWAGRIGAEHRKQILKQLELPESAGPAEWYLTEFEDNWAYKAAPGDVYFARSATQDDVRREAIITYVSARHGPDPMFVVMGCAFVFMPVFARLRRSA